MPTSASVGEWKTSSALRKVARHSCNLLSATSSRNSRLILNGRPASDTSTSPCADRADVLLEQADDMRGIERRGDGDHRARVGNSVRGGEHRGAAQAVADQDFRRAMRLAQMLGGGDQVVDVRGKMRVGEFAFAAAQPGEIEAQHGDAGGGEPLGDALGRQDVLAAGEAMANSA